MFPNISLKYPQYYIVSDMSGRLKQTSCCCPWSSGTGGAGRKREAEDPAGVGTKGTGPGGDPRTLVPTWGFP